MPDYYKQPDYLKDLYGASTDNTKTAQSQTTTPDLLNQNLTPVQPTQLPIQPQINAFEGENGEKPVDEKRTRKFNRRLLLIPLILVIGLIVVGGVLLLTRNTSPARPNVVLQWWGAFLEKEAVQPLIDEYQKQNPNVTIEYANKIRNNLPVNDEVKRYKDELNRVLTINNPVEIPDIFMVNSNWTGDYERFVRTSSSINASIINQSFYPAVATNFVKSNQVYGVPLWMDTYAVLFNKNLLTQAQVETPPTNWAQFKVLAKNLTKITNNIVTEAGFAMGRSTNVSYSDDLFKILLKQNGVTIANPTGSPVFASDTDSLSAVQFYKSFINDEKPTWSSTFENESVAFLEGKVAMIIVPSYRYREILRFNEKYDIGLNIGVSLLPQVDENQSRVNWSDYWGNMVASARTQSSNQEAWLFLNWMTQPAQLQKLNENVKNTYGYFGILYPRSDMKNELENDNFLKLFNQDLPNAGSWYMIKGDEIDSEIVKLLNETNTSQSQIDSLEKKITDLRANQGKF